MSSIFSMCSVSPSPPGSKNPNDQNLTNGCLDIPMEALRIERPLISSVFNPISSKYPKRLNLTNGFKQNPMKMLRKFPSAFYILQALNTQFGLNLTNMDATIFQREHIRMEPHLQLRLFHIIKALNTQNIVNLMNRTKNIPKQGALVIDSLRKASVSHCIQALHY